MMIPEQSAFRCSRLELLGSAPRVHVLLHAAGGTAVAEGRIRLGVFPRLGLRSSRSVAQAVQGRHGKARRLRSKWWCDRKRGLLRVLTDSELCICTAWVVAGRMCCSFTALVGLAWSGCDRCGRSLPFDLPRLRLRLAF